MDQATVDSIVAAVEWGPIVAGIAAIGAASAVPKFALAGVRKILSAIR